jgi:FHS family Na+ dependent glucose MFS transporter 1
MVGASLGPTLPGLAEHTKTLLSEISFLFTARSLGYLSGSFLGGRLYDRTPGHPLMAFAVVVIAAMMALAPLLPLLPLLTAVLLVLGVAEGTLDVGGNTLLVWVHRHRVGPFMNGLHFFFGLGATVSPIIVAQTVSMSGDIVWAYWVLAVSILPVALWLLRLSSPAARMEVQASLEGQASSDPRATRQPLLVVLIAIFFFLYAGAEIGFGGWIFSYAVESDLSNETNAAYLTSAFFGAFTLGRLLAIPLAARFRPRTILLTDLVGCLLSVGLILSWSSSVIALWMGAIGLGFSTASIFPTTLSLAERRMTITGRVTGWFFVGASAGGMTLPWLIGQLFESVGPRAMMAFILGDLVLATGVLAVLMLYSTANIRAA